MMKGEDLYVLQYNTAISASSQLQPVANFDFRSCSQLVPGCHKAVSIPAYTDAASWTTSRPNVTLAERDIAIRAGHMKTMRAGGSQYVPRRPELVRAVKLRLSNKADCLRQGLRHLAKVTLLTLPILFVQTNTEWSRPRHAEEDWLSQKARIRNNAKSPLVSCSRA